MVINHNISALNTTNKLSANTKAEQSSLEKLSSGSKINKAADDAAGLAISQKMQQQINGLDTANSNAQTGASMIQTAEGALSEDQSILQRMNELAVQAANGTNTSADQAKIQDEANTLTQTLNDIATQTTFNSKQIFGTTAGASLFTSTGIQLQIGAASGQTLNVELGDVTGAISVGGAVMTGVAADSLGVSTSQISLGNIASASAAITTITNAIDIVSQLRSKLGAYQNQLTHTENNLSTESENLQSAESNITDVDMASEMTAYTKNQILVQASESMLSQANQLPQGILSLLKS